MNLKIKSTLRTASLLVLGVAISVSALTIKSDAIISGCSMNVSPNTVTPGSNNYAVFNVQNTSDTPISNIKIVSPNAQIFTALSASAYQWQATTTSDRATFTEGALNPGMSLNFTVEFVASSTLTSSPASWTTVVSDDPSGSSPTTCSGEGGMSIASQPSVVTISDVGIVTIADTEVTINWTTDIPSTSQVDFGLTNEYGVSTPVSNELVTNHTLVLKNLKPSTAYHYQVTSTTPDGGSSTQGSNTFLTAVKSKDTLQIITIIGRTETIIESKPNSIPILATPIEKIAPTVSLTTRIPRVVKIMPLISGDATDNVALARIEYSLDGGKSWLLASKATGLGTKRATFSFTPGQTIEGDYKLAIRAVDTSGNIGLGSTQTIVLDRLPPIFSNLAVAFGPQTIDSDTSSMIELAVGSDYRVTGQSVGGATIINMVARNETGKAQTYSLSQDKTSGLWAGAMSFTKSGLYRLSVKSLDGADNKTERQIGQIKVAKNGTVSDKDNRPVKNAKITLYFMEPSTRRWAIWDGKPYGQTNPQKVDGVNYRYMIPAGEYYIKTSADNHGTVFSERFKITQAQSLNQTFVLSDNSLVRIGNFVIARPSWPEAVPYIASAKTDAAKSADILVGTTLPNFKLPSLTGGVVQKVDLFGRPSVVTLLDTWSPGGADQLAALAAAQKNPDIGVYPIFEGQSVMSVKSYLQLSGSKLNGIVDPDNSLAESLRAGFGPKHLFIDRSGHIKKVMVGVLSEEQILQELGGN